MGRPYDDRKAAGRAQSKKTAIGNTTVSVKCVDTNLKKVGLAPARKLNMQWLLDRSEDPLPMTCARRMSAR